MAAKYKCFAKCKAQLSYLDAAIRPQGQKLQRRIEPIFQSYK